MRVGNTMSCSIICENVLNETTNTCAEKCDPFGGYLYYRVENSRRICMDGCEDASRPEALYINKRPDGKGGVECAKLCTTGKLYVLPDGVCSELCPPEYVVFGEKCLTACPESARYATYTGLYWECVPKCKKLIYLSQPGGFPGVICLEKCMDKPLRLQLDGGFECLEKCDPNELLDGNKCVTRCKTGYSSGGLCVPQCEPD